MADFDAEQAQAQQQAHQNQYDQDQARIAFLERNVANISNALRHMQINIPAPVSQQIFPPNLNLPTNQSINLNLLLPSLALLFNFPLSK